ncbi:GlxA family transcriptional regulator [Pseudooceanicola algae]|uniref:HTH-type transcriptional regulator CdhR n=1 Tax=Pseudooceanicola algae TaxID=1537215 RepID=A0A418SD88_9RHOB|nr:GlxA family transcriptional regulator [Pseudooceanicola algae]QPM92286.1 HTH-type transcriptional regulator CdhR [Pseudooceanicola algae]
MPSFSPVQITFLLLDGFSNMVLASAIEPLRAACDLSGRRLFKWRIASIDGAGVRASSGLMLQADLALTQAGRVDVLVVIAGYGAREQAARSDLRIALRKAALKADALVGLDMGAWIAAAAGLLTGRRATVHWHEVDAFAEEFPGVTVVAESHVGDPDRMSAGSANSAMALMLDVIRRAAGDALAYDVSTLFVHDSREARRDDSGLLSPGLGRAIRAMLKHVEDPLPMVQIAGHAGLSLRTLDRHFRQELDVSAGAYYRSVRLARAQSLAVETSLTVREIATRTGFSSSATLARAFQAHYGRTLTATRG